MNTQPLLARMTHIKSNPFRGTGWLVLSLVTILVLLMAFTIKTIRGIEIFEATKPKGELTKIEETSLEVFLERTKLLINLALISFGALAAFLSKILLKSVRSKKLSVIGFISLALLIYSIFLGYYSYETILYLLTKGVFGVATPRVDTLAKLQCWTFIASMLLSVFVVQLNIQEGAKKP